MVLEQPKLTSYSKLTTSVEESGTGEQKELEADYKEKFYIKYNPSEFEDYLNWKYPRRQPSFLSPTNSNGTEISSQIIKPNYKRGGKDGFYKQFMAKKVLQEEPTSETKSPGQNLQIGSAETENNIEGDLVHKNTTDSLNAIADGIVEGMHSNKRTRCSASNKRQEKPRWQRQEQLVYMALCAIPGQESNRGDLLQLAVDLDVKIAKEKGIPRTFSGKTPKNSASAILTANSNKLFVTFKKPDSKLQHFKLAFPPNNFSFAVMKYKEWEKELYETKYPEYFSVENLSKVKNPITIETVEKVISDDDQNNTSLLLRLSQPNSPCPDIKGISIPKVQVVETKPWNKFEIKQTSTCTGTQPAINIPKSWKDVMEVRPSTVPGAGQGLFAKRNIPKDSVLGYYFGVPTTEYEFDHNKENVGLASHYSIMYQSTVLDATDENGHPFVDEDGPIYCPFHFMNEHPDWVNMAFLEGKQINMIECKSMCDIMEGEELFVFYGFEIVRGHYSLF